LFLADDGFQTMDACSFRGSQDPFHHTEPKHNHASELHVSSLSLGRFSNGLHRICPSEFVWSLISILLQMCAGLGMMDSACLVGSDITATVLRSIEADNRGKPPLLLIVSDDADAALNLMQETQPGNAFAKLWAFTSNDILSFVSTRLQEAKPNKSSSFSFRVSASHVGLVSSFVDQVTFPIIAVRSTDSTSANSVKWCF
jgi:hypothetical protein